MTWERIYAHDASGNSTYGELSDLRDAALNGADLKVRLFHGVRQTITGDRVLIDEKSDHVGLATKLTIYNVTNDGTVDYRNNKSKFKYFLIDNRAVFCTDGTETVSVSRNSEKKFKHMTWVNPAALDWFVRR